MPRQGQFEIGSRGGAERLCLLGGLVIHGFGLAPKLLHKPMSETQIFASPRE